MTCTTNDVPLGPPMVIHRAAPFPIAGQRFRTSARAPYDTSAVTMRIGVVGQTALIEAELDEDDSDPDDPYWSVTLTAEQTTVEPATGLEYVFFDADGLPLLYGPAEVIDHPRAA